MTFAPKKKPANEPPKANSNKEDTSFWRHSRRIAFRNTPKDGCCSKFFWLKATRYVLNKSNNLLFLLEIIITFVGHCGKNAGILFHFYRLFVGNYGARSQILADNIFLPPT